MSTTEGFDVLQISANMPKPENDPKSGECVKFGDTIVLYNAEVPSGKEDSEFTGQCNITFHSMNVLAVIFLTIFLPFSYYKDDLNLKNKHILAAGSYSVYLTYGFVNGYEVKSKEQMEFIIRSNVGNGSRDFPDLRKGRCVEDGDKIHLQANNMDSRWINGSRNGANVDVFSRDMLGNDYE